MSKFQLTIGAQDLATQIANLINTGRQLYVYLTSASILNGPVQYIIELHGSTVIGVVGLFKHNNRVTEIKHLAVHPDHRRLGIGRKLLQKAIEAANTDVVFEKVRSDNSVSIHNSLRIGLDPVCKTKLRRGHRMIIFARRRHGSTSNIKGGSR